jgi:hypothetical protein
MANHTRRSLVARRVRRAFVLGGRGMGASVLAAAALSAGLAVPAQAQSPAAPPSGDSWELTVAPYLMGAAIDGTTLIKGQSLDVDVSASDIFDNLDLGLMGMAAARKGHWGVVVDAVYVSLDVASEMPPAEFEPTIALFSIQGVRRLSDYADATLGARWNHLNAVIDLKAPVPMNLEKSRNWVDPVVGVVLRTPAAGRFHATLIADVGGFGIGSDFTWQVFPTVAVRLAKWASVEAGWRFLSVDYETGEGAARFAYDVLYQGPVVGFAFRF